MPFSNYIYEYYDGISSGNITVGKWVRLLYEYIVKGLQEGLFTFNAKKANKAIRFIENFCHHCEGRTDLLKLELWQKAAVSVMFGIVEEDGTRVFREVFIVIGRKNGKTLFASAVIAYMAYLDGEYGAKIYAGEVEEGGTRRRFHYLFRHVRRDIGAEDHNGKQSARESGRENLFRRKPCFLRLFPRSHRQRAFRKARRDYLRRNGCRGGERR